MTKIVSLSEVLQNKVLKEQELEFYQKRVKEIQDRIVLLESDLKLTRYIIELIESESIVEVNTDVPLIDIDDN